MRTPVWLACAALVAFPAAAAEFNAVQVDKSSVAFVSKQMNVPVEGNFRKFTAQIGFDPARPEAGHARVDIDVASIDAGGPEVNDEVRGKNWFDVGRYPAASFVSTGVKALGGGRFEAAGRMTIRGKTLDVHAPFTLRQDHGLLVIDGSFPIKRLDYGIGTGVWGDTSVVADEVQVKFHIVVGAGKT